MHSATPPTLTEPGGHATHVRLSAAGDVPTGQATHWVAFGVPGELDAVPGGQGSQLDVAALDHVPAGQMAQVFLSTVTQPGLHAVHSTASSALRVLPEQSEHLVRSSFMNFPARHDWHSVVADPGAMVPSPHASHVHAVVFANFPGSHTVHCDAPSALTDPGPQLRHLGSPAAGVYMPGAHFTHSLWSADGAEPLAQMVQAPPVDDTQPGEQATQLTRVGSGSVPASHG